ncbi:unnamed protein product [Malus baccata var. baccata]
MCVFGRREKRDRRSLRVCVCLGEGRRGIEKDRERIRVRLCLRVMFVCVRVWLRALCHLCVCYSRQVHNYLDNLITFTIIICILFRPWMVVSFKTVEYQRSLFDYFISLTPFKDNFNMFNVIYYFISLTIFKAIPDPFQSLNTKGSIFKVSLQTYIYIIVIYTTINKFVWTRMLIFLSN